MTPRQKLALSLVRAKFKILSSISKQRAAASAFELFCTPQQRNRKKLPPVFERSERLEFPFEEETVRGYRWNHHINPGKKAVILHGFESSVINFERYIDPLLKK